MLSAAVKHGESELQSARQTARRTVKRVAKQESTAHKLHRSRLEAKTRTVKKRFLPNFSSTSNRTLCSGPTVNCYCIYVAAHTCPQSERRKEKSRSGQVGVTRFIALGQAAVSKKRECTVHGRPQPPNGNLCQAGLLIVEIQSEFQTVNAHLRPRKSRRSTLKPPAG